MAIYIITAPPGGGKSLYAVDVIQKKIVQGCIVATNLNLKPHNFPQVGRMAKSPKIIRLPDKPTIADLVSIGLGNTSYDESMNGILVLDECGTWFNARTWNDKSRSDVIDWLLHSRKKGWDVYFIIQHAKMLDKQALMGLGEHVIFCKRMDRIAIPVIGFLFEQFLSSKIKLPKLHLAITKYGASGTSLIVNRFFYRGHNLYQAYDTKQEFTDNYDTPAYGLLPPYITHGQFSVKHDREYYMRLTKIYFKRLSRPIAFFVGVGLCFAYSWITSPATVTAADEVIQENKAPVYDFDTAKISSFSRLGNDFSIALVNKSGESTDSKDLLKEGYNLRVIDDCHIKITRGKNESFDIGC
ncbi:assembly protein [Salmonella enterica]|nr:assembly protein [Salmonella enterica]